MIIMDLIFLFSGKFLYSSVYTQLLRNDLKILTFYGLFYL